MPFRSLFSSTNNEASSSRKRSYAEITRSESRSQSPQHQSSKRRRTGPAATPSTSGSTIRSPSPHISTSHPNPPLDRYPGDGLDYRRPIMSTSATTQTGHTAYIDLTAEESRWPSPQASAADSEPDRDGPLFRAQHRRRTQEEQWYEAAEVSRSESRAREEHARRRDSAREATLARIQQARNRGPRFGRDIIGENIGEPEVIDLVDSDETEDVEVEPTLGFEEDLFRDHIDRSSPEITFVSERPAPGAESIERGSSRLNLRRLPTPQDRRGPVIPNTFQNLREFVRQGTFGYRALSDNEIDEAREALDRETLDRIDGIRDARPNQPNREDRARSRLDRDVRDRPMHPFGDFPIVRPPRPASIGIPDFIDVEDLEMNMELDYENAAFEVGDPDRLEIVEAPTWPAMNARRGDTPIELVKEPYLRPRARAKGFTMNFAEDDCLECPNCHEELSVGDEGSAKGQVWMVRSCGHVYCGECAINRAASRQKKVKALRIETNVTPFKKCLVQDCGKSVIAKNTMVHIYL